MRYPESVAHATTLESARVIHHLLPKRHHLRYPRKGLVGEVELEIPGIARALPVARAAERRHRAILSEYESASFH